MGKIASGMMGRMMFLINAILYILPLAILHILSTRKLRLQGGATIASS